jgi:hypothetical protein
MVRSASHFSATEGRPRVQKHGTGRCAWKDGWMWLGGRAGEARLRSEWREVQRTLYQHIPASLPPTIQHCSALAGSTSRCQNASATLIH